MPNDAEVPRDESADDPWEITRPGARSGRGVNSLLPYLNNARDTAPAELQPVQGREQNLHWLTKGVRWVLRKR